MSLLYKVQLLPGDWVRLDAPNDFLVGHQYRFQNQEDEALLIFEGDTPSDAGASTLAAGGGYTVTYRHGAIWAKSSDALSVVGIEDLGPETGNAIDGGTTALLKQNFAAANTIAAIQDDPASQTDQAATYGQLQDALPQFNGPDGASLIGYKARTVAAELDDGWANPKRYGAKGDGRADDSVAIQAAIDELAARGGGVVRFPNGEYRCNVILRDGVHLISGAEMFG